jgi:hypothetical protein
MRRPTKAFTLGVCLAFSVLWVLGWMFIPVNPVLWSAVALVGGICAVSLWNAKSRLGGEGDFICDGCKYDNERDCSHPERPNATRCDDFKPRGS